MTALHFERSVPALQNSYVAITSKPKAPISNALQRFGPQCREAEL